jgi:type VI secretion system protein ImpM
MTRLPAAGGLFGKTPTLGDFVQRRLPQSFVRPWDAWLSQSLAASRSLVPGDWTSIYLKSPPWRFALDPGVAGPEGWIGALASSIDSVRRAYPITVAAPMPEGARLADLRGEIDPLVAELEAIALQLAAGALAPDVALTALDATSPIALERAFRSDWRFHGSGARLQIGVAGISVRDMILRLAPEALAAGAALTLWWRESWSGAPSACVVASGLPAAEAFAAFLDGEWAERGWAPGEPEDGAWT